MLRPCTVGTIFGTLFLTLWCVASSGQEPKSGSDDALDSLIEKLEDSATSKAEAKSSGATKKPDYYKKEAETKARAKAVSGAQDPGSKPVEGKNPKLGSGADVGAKDQELDSLLEKLGESKDEPQAEDSKRPKSGPGDGTDKGKMDGSKPQPPTPDQLGKKDQELDERLEELTGRRRKKQSNEDEDGSGPVSEVVKQMREIEKRLGKPDTGDETRSKQKQIVKRLETLIEQARQSGSSSSSQMKIRQVRQAGQKPGGNQPGQEAGANAGGAPLSKPSKPNNQRSMAGGKDVWGHLPPELRQEMENSFKEEALPDKIELIKRYYLSVSKNKLVREE